MAIIALMCASQQPGTRDEDVGHALVRDHTVYSCVMGSRAFGLATDASDTDRRGVFVAPTPLYWRFDKPPTHVTGPRDEEFSWEIERFCSLALRGNPNLLECLHSPHVEYADRVGRELLDLRGAFLSRQAEPAFRGYAQAQMGKIEAAVRTQGTPRWKHAMHLLRLLISCRDLLRTGRLTVDVGEHRDSLLAVRRGERRWEEVRAWARTLDEECTAAAARTPLPPAPDRARVEDFLIRVRGLTAAPPSPLPRTPGAPAVEPREAEPPRPAAPGADARSRGVADAGALAPVPAAGGLPASAPPAALGGPPPASYAPATPGPGAYPPAGR